MRPVRRASSGFTLIELLVVVAIVSILAAIAIPAFTSRQGKAFDARVMQDARNAANGEEAYFTDNASYFTGPCEGLPGMAVSDGVICDATGAGLDFSIATSHPRATRSCIWSSNTTPNLICTTP
jgi:type IV pilus assembly protein PilE